MAARSLICAGLEDSPRENHNKFKKHRRLRAQIKEFQEVKRENDKKPLRVRKVDASCTVSEKLTHKSAECMKVLLV